METELSSSDHGTVIRILSRGVVKSPFTQNVVTLLKCPFTNLDPEKWNSSKMEEFGRTSQEPASRGAAKQQVLTSNSWVDSQSWIKRKIRQGKDRNATSLRELTVLKDFKPHVDIIFPSWSPRGAQTKSRVVTSALQYISSASTLLPFVTQNIRNLLRLSPQPMLEGVGLSC